MDTEPSNFQGGPSAVTPGALVPRLAARLIDSIIVGIIGLLLGAILEFGVLWLVVEAIGVFAYFVLLDVNWGTTPGKQLLGLRVTGPGGGYPTMPQAASREAFTLLGAIPFIGPLLTLAAWVMIGVSINASPTKQGKHDELAGGTQVIRR